jgi:hypothetical protein
VHYGTVHKLPVGKKSADADTIKKFFRWKQEYNANSQPFSWVTRPYETNSGWVFPSAHLRNGQIYIYLRMNAHSSVTEKLKCQITVSNAQSLISFPGQVYPIDWTREMIMAKCVCLSIWSIQQMLTENPSEEDKKKGYGSRFNVTFNIVKCTIVIVHKFDFSAFKRC